MTNERERDTVYFSYNISENRNSVVSRIFHNIKSK